MFQICSSLNYIKVGATSWNTTYASNWSVVYPLPEHLRSPRQLT